MTADEHYQKAEHFLRRADQATQYPKTATRFVALAHVHATLALAAATNKELGK